MKDFVKITFVLFVLVLLSNGCMRFTQRDYDLQKQAYEKERQMEAERDKERLQLKW